MNVAYIGNFGVEFTTESEVARALEANGHRVERLQENVAETWATDLHARHHADLLLWTRTGWDWPHTPMAWSHEEAKHRQRLVLAAGRSLGVPSVGYHLDRWWGLNREGQVHDEPFFRCDLVVTADGGHDDEFAAAGVNHRWFPPGAGAGAGERGTPQPRYSSDVAFVGSWRPGYHREWRHRPQLVTFLERNYRRRIKFWPERGKPAVRQAELLDLYASAKVFVGDSCLVPNADGSPATRYWSDRIPETLGRGGFLIHPWVEGIDEHFTDGEHLRLWPLGDWAELKRLIDYYLVHDDERRAIAEAGQRHVVEHHTYTVRMRQLVELLHTEALLVAA